MLGFHDWSWVRMDVALIEMPLPKEHFHVVDGAGAGVLCQQTGPNELLILAEGVPPLGYAAYHVVPGMPSAENTLKASSSGMENDFVRLTFDKKGQVARLYDKLEGRDVLMKGKPGNVLELFEDRPHGNDAWDIDPNFEEVSWEACPAESVEAVETGPVRAIVRIVRKTERSVITQDVTLHAHSSRVDFVTHADWHEKRVLLKAAFPVDIRASHATYEIQYAAIERATHRNTDFDRARYEVPAHKWADLSEGDYGVSLLSDCKYGYETKGNLMRVSLLRSPVDPDPTADEGEHRFTYSIYPHAWTWRNGTVQEGFELNSPLLAFAAPTQRGVLPSNGAFASVDVDHVIIDTIKRCEDSNALIVRVYEAYGQRGPVALTLGHKPKQVTECDLMEEHDAPVKVKGSTIRFDVTPFEIRSFKVAF